MIFISEGWSKWIVHLVNENLFKIENACLFLSLLGTSFHRIPTYMSFNKFLDTKLALVRKDTTCINAIYQILQVSHSHPSPAIPQCGIHTCSHTRAHTHIRRELFFQYLFSASQGTASVNTVFREYFVITSVNNLQFTGFKL